MTAEHVVRFPVICPKCRQEVLTAVPIGIAAAALISGRPIRLYASCHDVYWDAHSIEIEQLREYMGAPLLRNDESTDGTIAESEARPGVGGFPKDKGPGGPQSAL
jgi:hypothetical protein